jgi:nitroreductase
VSELSLHDAIYTTRAMRHLGTEPVSEDDLRYIVEAATMAPSGANEQKYVLARGLESGGLSDRAQRVYRNAMRLVEHLGEAPALILACVRERPPGDPAAATAYYGSIFPAIQNLMLAARARGLGTTLTTLHKLREDDVRQVLEIPDEVETVALIPVGRPRGSWGRPRRRPSSEVTHWNRWGERRQASA